MNDMTEIKRMTFAEYHLRMTAYRLRDLDEEYRIARQAWSNRDIKATKKKGKNKYEPYYRTFKSFFDYRKLENDILHLKEDENTVTNRYMEYMRKKANGDI